LSIIDIGISIGIGIGIGIGIILIHRIVIVGLRAGEEWRVG
jgi:hypothetical protein